ncbi:MAG: ribonuclease R [Sphingobacteriales bacterium]|jgi:ribonuclease R
MSKKTQQQGTGKAEVKAKTWLVKPILEVLTKNPRQKFNNKQVCHRLGISDKKARSLAQEVLQTLCKKGEIIEAGPGRYQFKQDLGFFEGKIEITKRGSGYVLNSDGDDIYVPEGKTNFALNGDIVKVELMAGRRSGLAGIVVEIVERSRTEFVCTLQKNKGGYFGIPDSRKMSVDFFIHEDQLGGATAGQKVIVALDKWMNPEMSPYGKVIKILGNPGDIDTEMFAVLAENQLPLEFPENVEKDAEALTDEISDKELKQRRDFRDVLTFTIDPDDAKDFDDALSFKELDKGFFEVGVHIADVAHYVTEGSELDKEARKRATSVYLVDRVIPMLPEVLSNGLCSLRPNETKRTYSAVFEINEKGKIRSEWFGRTVIHSDIRYTYGTAQELIESGEGKMGEILQLLNRTAKNLRAERSKKGSIEFGSEEVKFQMDDQGKPIAVIPKKLVDANRLIEDYMLLANRKVSAFIANHPVVRTPSVYRIHDRPNPEKWSQFGQLCHEMGYELQGNVTSSDVHTSLNEVLKAAEGTPEQSLIHTMAIKTMAKAVYSTDNVGHFGLAFSHYSHFTSPIRRYPDVLLHRILTKVLDGKSQPDANALEETCKHCSLMEKRAVDAERSSIKYMQVSYLSQHIGEVFDGVISGVTNWGLFVEIIENRCEGLLAMEKLDDDRYTLDDLGHKLVGQNHGHEYKLGDPIRIQVEKASMELKQVDFDLPFAEM